MKTSPIYRFTVHPLLFVLEFVFKIAAGVVALIVLAAPDSFLDKLATGFGSLSEVYHKLAAWPEKLSYISMVIEDYNTQTAADFHQRYGGQAMDRVMDMLNEGVAFFQAVYQNLAEQPIATIGATLLAFLLFYACGRTCRFVRQRGQGSFLVRKEREIGNRIFKKNEA
ncbi:hypothetical protein [Gracilimonas mengyeensis]|uniref:Uncharacterized protein n=1 Tax=Gracilimonas mengyeensis TaxID=1302730 RepID=A0A521CHL6_9BACT|nr:hypothetical protein [Gracilimonas mengyeensis]SMO58200.1 hypothetical protein SAMN06265219_105110 [Gracilimonas mengyeensis]